MPEQTKYMDLNTFLKNWLSIDQGYDIRMIADFLVVHYNDLYNRKNHGKIDQYFANRAKQELDSLYTEQAKEIMDQFVKAIEDPSPEATDFLDILQKFTAFYSLKQLSDMEVSEYAQVQVNVISRGRIKDPMHAYMLLSKMESSNRLGSKLLLDVLHLKVTNPNATLNDVKEYARLVANHQESPFFAGAVDELMSMLNDHMTRIDERITAELNKDVPDKDNIVKLHTEQLLHITQCISDIMSKQEYPVTKLKEMSELRILLASKYDINKILDVEQGNYVQQFETRASLKVAEAEEKLKDAGKIQSDLEAAMEKITELEAQIAELNKASTQNSAEQEHFMKILEIKIGAIKTFLMSFDEKKGQTFNRGRDLAELGEFLKTAMYGDPKDPEKSYNWIKEMETMIAKRKTEQMQGARI